MTKNLFEIWEKCLPNAFVREGVAFRVNSPDESIDGYWSIVSKMENGEEVLRFTRGRTEICVCDSYTKMDENGDITVQIDWIYLSSPSWRIVEADPLGGRVCGYHWDGKASFLLRNVHSALKAGDPSLLKAELLPDTKYTKASKSFAFEILPGLGIKARYLSGQPVRFTALEKLYWKPLCAESEMVRGHFEQMLERMNKSSLSMEDFVRESLEINREAAIKRANQRRSRRYRLYERFIQQAAPSLDLPAEEWQALSGRMEQYWTEVRDHELYRVASVYEKGNTPGQITLKSVHVHHSSLNYRIDAESGQISDYPYAFWVNSQLPDEYMLAQTWDELREQLRSCGGPGIDDAQAMADWLCREVQNIKERFDAFCALLFAVLHHNEYIQLLLRNGQYAAVFHLLRECYYSQETLNHWDSALRNPDQVEFALRMVREICSCFPLNETSDCFGSLCRSLFYRTNKSRKDFEIRRRLLLRHAEAISRWGSTPVMETAPLSRIIPSLFDFLELSDEELNVIERAVPDDAAGIRYLILFSNAQSYVVSAGLYRNREALLNLSTPPSFDMKGTLCGMNLIEAFASEPVGKHAPESRVVWQKDDLSVEWVHPWQAVEYIMELGIPVCMKKITDLYRTSFWKDHGLYGVFTGSRQAKKRLGCLVYTEAEDLAIADTEDRLLHSHTRELKEFARSCGCSLDRRYKSRSDETEEWRSDRVASMYCKDLTEGGPLSPRRGNLIDPSKAGTAFPDPAALGKALQNILNYDTLHEWLSRLYRASIAYYMDEFIYTLYICYLQLLIALKNLEGDQWIADEYLYPLNLMDSFAKAAERASLLIS